MSDAVRSRRGLLQLTAFVATMGLMRRPHAGAASAAARVGEFDPANGSESASADANQGASENKGASTSTVAATSLGLAEAQTLWARLNGDLSGRTVYFTTIGDVWGFLPQADELKVDDFAKRAYGYAGVAARKMQRRADGSIVMRQKSWAFYRDPETEQLGDRITNRWTGVVDTALPLSGSTSERLLPARPDPATTPDPYRMQVRRIGARAFVSTSNMVRFRPRDADWFKLEGNLASHHCAARDLDDPRLTHLPSTCTQNLVAEWQTWTRMHGRPGHILFRGDGVPLFGAAEIPDDLQRAIRAFFPGQLEEVAAWK